MHIHAGFSMTFVSPINSYIIFNQPLVYFSNKAVIYTQNPISKVLYFTFLFIHCGFYRPSLHRPFAVSMYFKSQDLVDPINFLIGLNILSTLPPCLRTTSLQRTNETTTSIFSNLTGAYVHI